VTPRLHFHGAAGTVTGSCYLLRTGAASILIDCGLFQGSKTEKELNYRAFPFRPSEIDAVLLTHAHIDHSGLLPKLAREGFAGPIYATAGTVDLCAVMLADSAYIQELEVSHLNRRNARRGRGEVEPIYTTADATACQALFRPVDYDRWLDISGMIRARYWNAGHMLGSASIEVEIAGEAPLSILFAGDIGPSFKLLHRDAEAPSGVDYVVIESTYGATDRRDASPAVRRLLLRNEVAEAVLAGGAIVVPSFAVERTQELLADIVNLMENGEAPAIPVFIDSPLATKATEVFRNHLAEIENGDMLARALASEHVKFTQSVEESKALDQIAGPHIVIAASGMCEAGRIRHRLRNWLWRPEATVLFVGYQAEGTLGRILLDGATAVRIQGDEISVRARIRSLDLYSGHADGPELSNWVAERRPIRRGVFVVHGEPVNADALRQRLTSFLPPDKIVIPTIDDGYELTSSGAIHLEPTGARRIAPERIASRDWHNELSELILDIRDELDKSADEKARNVVVRRLRRALEGGSDR
jgi:metallo-beta-lactamase family protein